MICVAVYVKLFRLGFNLEFHSVAVYITPAGIPGWRGLLCCGVLGSCVYYPDSDGCCSCVVSNEEVCKGWGAQSERGGAGEAPHVISARSIPGAVHCPGEPRAPQTPLMLRGGVMVQLGAGELDGKQNALVRWGQSH